MSLKGKVALVTGGAKGIGRATALALAGEGANVAITYLASKREALQVVGKIRKLKRRAEAFPGDVTDPISVARLFAEVRNNLGRVDILVNNVGNFVIRKAGETGFSEFDDVIKSNLYSVYLCSKEVLPGMRKRKWGRIVNLAFAGADRQGGFQNISAYAAAKMGVVTFTRTLAKEEAKNRITVNAVGPGIVDTGILPKMKKELIKLCPLGRLARPEEVARVISFLCQPKSEYITGAHITVAGGWGL